MNIMRGSDFHRCQKSIMKLRLEVWLWMVLGRTRAFGKAVADTNCKYGVNTPRTRRLIEAKTETSNTYRKL